MTFKVLRQQKNTAVKELDKKDNKDFIINYEIKKAIRIQK